MDAKFYCALHRGYPGDVAFYTSVCEDAARVLELGCGDGRITKAIASVAEAVVGIDHHEGMLARAQAGLVSTSPSPANVVWHLCSMAEIEHLGTFDRIIIPFTTIYCLDRETLIQCLAQIGRMLSADGILAFDAYPAEIFHQSSLSHAEWDAVGEIQVDDLPYLVEEETTVWRGEQKLRVAYRHTPVSGGAVIRQYAIIHHYVLLSEWPDLLKDAGLSTCERYGGFDGRPFHEDADRIVVIASR